MREIGLLTAEPSALLLDHVAAAGLAFLVLDAELTALEAADCAHVARHLSGSAVRVVARVPDIEPTTLVRFANAGVDELMLPQVRSLEEVVRAWRSVRFPPVGDRPRQPTRASGYGTRWDEAPGLSVIVETVEAVDAAPDLASSGLLAGAWLGATDLTDELRRLDLDLDLEATTDELLRCFESAGVPFGIGAADAVAAGDVFERGASRCFLQWERLLGAVLAPLAAAAAVPPPTLIEQEPARASTGPGGQAT